MCAAGAVGYGRIGDVTTATTIVSPARRIITMDPEPPPKRRGRSTRRGPRGRLQQLAAAAGVSAHGRTFAT
jgi:hypothetical protein